MQVAEYVVNQLIKYGVTDTFGIPGGVILGLIETMDKRAPRLIPHLNYHEQMAGFAACGYAQASGKLGVAYATRGPGITNMITCVAEAYQESLPVLFITGHGATGDASMRFENNQEIDIVSMVSNITKYAVSINSVTEAAEKIRNACELAMEGRKGPTVIDVSSDLWAKEIEKDGFDIKEKKQDTVSSIEDNKMQEIIAAIQRSKRPLLLIGDGLRNCYTQKELRTIADQLAIPVLSSRGAQDLMSDSRYYFGYIGSHGCRYSNFILSKSDLIISIGNRLAFPIKSESFAPVFQSSEVIRVDIDGNEFARKMPNSLNIKSDARLFLDALLKEYKVEEDRTDWIEICNLLKTSLNDYDMPIPVVKIANYMKLDNDSAAYVCDVGNNEFWAARAFESVHPRTRMLCSKSYGTLGSALGKAIGAYYALRRQITCIIGDQGFQFNLQELQFISREKLPIRIIVLNNNISGMILDHEKAMKGGILIHVSKDTGYYAANLRQIARAYDVEYTDNIKKTQGKVQLPLLIEVEFDSNISLTPTLPKGNECQDMAPLIDRALYRELKNL